MRYLIPPLDIMETRKKNLSASGQVEKPEFTKGLVRSFILYDFLSGVKPVQCLEKLKTVMGEEAPTLAMITKWFNRFRSGNFSVEDARREGRPKTATNDDNVAAVKAAIEEDSRVTLEKLEELLGIDATSIWRILTENLGFSKKAAKWVPHQLTPEHKASRVIFSRQCLQRFKDGKSAAWKQIVTGDETWIYNCDPETKSQSMVWSKIGEPPPKKFRRARSARRTMFAIFFGFKGIVASIPLEERRTVNSEWYTEVCLPQVFEKLLRGRPKKELRRHILHHDNAPAHTSGKTLNFIADSGIDLLTPPAYSPDLAPCDFWLFPKLKEPLRGKLFETREDLVSAVEEQLSLLKPEDFHQCFDRWIHRMKKCLDVGGDYVERS